MKYTKSKYEEILSDLISIRSGWERLGYNLSATRFGAYERHLLHLIKLGPNGRAALSSEEKGQIYLLGAEISELLFASKIALNREHFVNSPRIAEVFSGPDFCVSENDRGNDKPRNTLFELTIAARIEMAGLRAEFGGITDIKTIFDETPIAIEAKRPQSLKKAETSIRCAVKQLSERSFDESEIRIVAICIGKMLSNGTHILVCPTIEELNLAIDNIVSNFHQSTRRFWQKKKNIDGLIVRVSVPGIINNDAHCYASPMTLFTSPHIAESKASKLRLFVARLEENIHGNTIE